MQDWEKRLFLLWCVYDYRKSCNEKITFEQQMQLLLWVITAESCSYGLHFKHKTKCSTPVCMLVVGLSNLWCTWTISCIFIKKNMFPIVHLWSLWSVTLWTLTLFVKVLFSTFQQILSHKTTHWPEYYSVLAKSLLFFLLFLPFYWIHWDLCF